MAGYVDFAALKQGVSIKQTATLLDRMPSLPLSTFVLAARSVQKEANG
jgi:hypothetical protein